MLRKEGRSPVVSYAWVPYLLTMLLFLALMRPNWLHRQAMMFGPFADAHVYGRAIRTAALGLDPYRTPALDLPFVYPPLVLRCGVLLRALVLHHVSFCIYILLTWAGVLSLPWIICSAYIRSQWFTPWLGMLIFAFQPFFTYEGVVFTGNIVLILLPLALLAGVRGVRHRRWGLFYVVVGLCALIKAPMLALLLLPALSEDKEWKPSIFTTIAVCAVYLAQRLAMPQAYGEYQRNAWEQVIVHKDTGFNLLSYVTHQERNLAVLRHAAVPPAIQVAVIALLAAAFYWYRRRREDEDLRPLWMPALLVLSILADPRLQHIDACAAILPCLYLWVECIRRLARNPQWWRIFVLAFVFFQFLTPKQFEMGEIGLLYGSLLLVLAVTIRPPAILSQSGPPLATAADR
ncbi:MAG TPA: hypothetical protein VMD97_09850 [Candidatus Aquilonibacter sp.]|nr:hypothetical protein [Candidatus Aquilonibacter sp.]